MGKMNSRYQSGAVEQCPRSATAGVAAAVLCALYGAHPAVADQPSAVGGTLEEVVVTATRRQQALEAVPYSISSISEEQIDAAGITDIASLAAHVPGLSIYDYGARFAGAVTPIIRGINATGSPPRGFRTFEQAPVGTYVGNSPVEGYVLLDDVARVEILRGPQGTLYGAGALGGALRFIPNAPQLNATAASIEASVSNTAHSTGNGYSVEGMANVSLGDSMAMRVSGKYAYDPGWIKAFGLLDRTNTGVYGVPLLATPGDTVNSAPIYNSRSNWNDQRTMGGRASLLWKPNDKFNAEAAVLLTYVHGEGGPQVNPDYAGGVSPFDPSTTYPAGGHYQEFALIQEPFDRHTSLLSLDASYDAGFATISSTTSYQETSGSLIQDSSFDYAGFAGGAFLPYYAGIPVNPRFTYPFLFTDAAHTFTQELRLVSKTDPSNTFDYVAGLFYEKQTRHGSWFVTNPGSPERSVAQGCTAYVGTLPFAFPNCLLLSGPNDTTFQQIDEQQFQDKSVFGELTWHFIPHGQITFGGRHFSQEFTDEQLYQDFTFSVVVPPIPYNSPASKNVWKVNPSYEYDSGHFVYALWSQGFRRGGANSVPSSGIFQESPLLRFYQPDTTDNYELGLKGRFANGLSYAAAIFDIKWDKPQISSSLPSGNLAVYNANTAESKGFELESTGPLLPHLSYTIGYAYADAKLTSDFSYPANDGLGNIVPGLLSGHSGQQLPGSPKNSVSVMLMYQTPLTSGSTLELTADGAYRSAAALQVAPSVGTTTVQHSSSYLVMDLSATLTHKPWHGTLYVTNLLDRQEILAPPSQPNQVNNLTNDYLVNSPRQIGVRVGYTP